mgnify:CR=1 FL=1
MVQLEVEAKVKLNKDQVSIIRKKILKIAKFSKKVKKADDYFAIKHGFAGLRYPKKAFRIRDDGKYIVNFKKWLRKYWSNGVVVKEEYEFEIEKPKNFLYLMKDLGFIEWMKKIKISEKYVHKKDNRINIEINKVKHLGYFIEIEYIAKKSEIQKAKNKVFSTLIELGIEKQVNNKGYTRMLWDKGIRDKKYFLH